MRQLVLGIAALGIACANSRPTAPETASAASDAAPTSPATTTPVEAAAEFAITMGTVVVAPFAAELDRAGDPVKVLELLAPLASRLSVDRNDCRSEPSAILSIGQPQVAGDQARVDVGVVLGSAGMLELEHRQGSWQVVRVTSPWISDRTSVVKGTSVDLGGRRIIKKKTRSAPVNSGPILLPVPNRV